MIDPPPMLCVVVVPGFQAASMMPVSRTTFKGTMRIPVIFGRAAASTAGSRQIAGTVFTKSRLNTKAPFRTPVPLYHYSADRLATQSNEDPMEHQVGRTRWLPLPDAFGH